MCHFDEIHRKALSHEIAFSVQSNSIFLILFRQTKRPTPTTAEQKLSWVGVAKLPSFSRCNKCACRLSTRNILPTASLTGSANIGFVAQIGLSPDFHFTQTDLSYGHRDGYAERGVAVEHRDAALDFGNLSIEVSRHQGSAEKLDAVHFTLDAASTVVSAPLLPDGVAEVSRCIACLVAGDSFSAGGFPRLGILARRAV